MKLFLQFDDNETAHLKSLLPNQEFSIKQDELVLHFHCGYADEKASSETEKLIIQGTIGYNRQMDGGRPVSYRFLQESIQANTPIHAEIDNSFRRF